MAGHVPANAVCCKCNRFASQSLGAQWFCDDCYSAIIEPIRRRVIERQGMVDYIRRFRSVAVAPADVSIHGPNMWRNRCEECGASWVGRMGDPCSWCDDRYEREHQAEINRLLSKGPSWLS